MWTFQFWKLHQTNYLEKKFMNMFKVVRQSVTSLDKFVDKKTHMRRDDTISDEPPTLVEQGVLHTVQDEPRNLPEEELEQQLIWHFFLYWFL